MSKSPPLQRVEQTHIQNTLVSLAALHPHPLNYNDHPEQQLKDLKASHHDLGQFQSIVVWQQPDDSYVIVSGHGFVEGARRDGATEIRADILPPETPAETIEAILIAANQHQRNSVPDDERLGRLLQKQRDAGVRLSALGTDDEAVRQLLKSVENSHATDFLKPLLATPALPSSPSLSSFVPSSPAFSRAEEGEQGEAVPSTGNEYHSNGSVAGGPAPTEGYVSATYLPFTVSVLPEQRQTILSAIKKAQQQWELETSQNALTAICQQYLQAS